MVAGVLAVTGSTVAFVAWVFPVLWFGYAVWVGWVANALGHRRWQEKWFWLVSAGWNIALVLVLLTMLKPAQNADAVSTAVSFDVFATFVMGHLFAAAIVSTILAVVVPWDTWPENRRA